MVSAVLNLFESVLISGLLHSAKGKGDVMRPPFMSILVMLATMVTLDPVSHATVVYHSAGVTVEGGAYALDVDGDTVTDFYFSVDRQSGFPPCNHSVEVKESAAPGNLAVEGGPLNKGDPIGPSYETFTGDTQVLASIDYQCGRPTRMGGDWWGVTDHYLGLSFQINGETHYGWAQLGVDSNAALVLTGYAYETTADMPIKAGLTTDVKFTPGSLGFGIVVRGRTVSRTATLTNLDATPLRITDATLTGLNSRDFASENSNPPCGGTLAVGATCTLTFSFTPTMVGKEKAVYTVTYVGGGTTTKKLGLTGTGQ